MISVVVSFSFLALELWLVVSKEGLKTSHPSIMPTGECHRQEVPLHFHKTSTLAIKKAN